MADEKKVDIESKRVPVERLRPEVDISTLGVESTRDVEPLKGTIGQERALEALTTGLDIQAPGFNVYASGHVGTGRSSSVLAMVRERAKDEPVPDDWCYVYNFAKPDEPNAIELPAGMGRDFAADMEKFIEHVQREIPEAFQGKEYEREKAEVGRKLQEKRDELLQQLEEEANKLDHTVRMTQNGVMLVPVVKGQPVSAEEFERLPDEMQEDLREKSHQLQGRVAEALAEVRRIEQQMREEAEDLDKRIAERVVSELLQPLQEKYGGYDEVGRHLDAVKNDVVDNAGTIKQGQEKQQMPQLLAAMQAPQQNLFRKYRVNVVVDHKDARGAPVIDERNPTYYNLFGRLEYRSQMGGMVTDFTMIKGGAFQQAAGGYLVLQVLDVLLNPFAWEALKRSLRTGEARIENMYEQYRPVPAQTLRPEPIPATVKVVLVGSRFLYQLLYALDKDFRRLFKIRADFDTEMDLTDEHLHKYASFISARCEENELPPFDRGAIARLAQYGRRIAEHQDRLSTCFLDITNLITEAGYQAKHYNGDTVSEKHVRRAIEARRRRSRMLQDKIQRHIEEGMLLIDTEDSVPGQINGLSVFDLGDYRFGKPTRITCVTAVGRRGVLNIERESKMSGSIHDKGVLIMSGYLANLFGQDKPLSLSASLCFEQSYGEVDGDSASCTELYALLSSLSGLPLRQDIAVTGSVNQRGQVQTVGGVNEKIEGFFEVCQARGLTGEQGVMLPSRNLKTVMLDEEVVKAVHDGTFHVYAVDTVAEGIEVLTGVPAGERAADGTFPEDTVFGRVDRRLREMAQTMMHYGGGAGQDEEGDETEEE